MVAMSSWVKLWFIMDDRMLVFGNTVVVLYVNNAPINDVMFNLSNVANNVSIPIVVTISGNSPSKVSLHNVMMRDISDADIGTDISCKNVSASVSVSVSYRFPSRDTSLYLRDIAY